MALSELKEKLSCDSPPSLINHSPRIDTHNLLMGRYVFSRTHTPHSCHTQQVKHKLVALSGLKEKLEEMHLYLQQVLEGKLPVNNQVWGREGQAV